MRITGQLLMLVLALVRPSLSQTPSWLAPGTETEISWLGTETPTRVFLPEDFVVDRAWPVLFYFHGTGGQSSTRLVRKFTRQRGYIIVGMSYAVPGAGSLAAEAVQKQIAHIARVRTMLGRHAMIQDRTFVSGFSKGGWMADLLATHGFPTLAGALIMGAGKLPEDVGRALQQDTSQKTNLKPAIYIGIGQLDSNAVYSRRALKHYRGRGSPVTFDEFLGKGHQPPTGPDSEYLFQWLAVHAQPHPDAALRKQADVWLGRSLTFSETIEQPVERLLYLERVANAPFAGLAPADAEKIRKIIAGARRHRSLHEEVEAETAYWSALRQEQAFRRSEDLIGISRHFQNLASQHPKTHYGKRAALDLTRLHKNFRTLRSPNSAALTFPPPEVDAEALTAEFLSLGGLLNR